MTNAHKILLHTCCAPCSAAIIEWLLQHEIQPVLFYYNPNIFPQKEYLIRKEECTKYATSLGLQIIDGDYEHDSWLTCIKGFEDEPERGKRCYECFKMRMQVSAAKAHELGIDIYTTTLASSRWKNLDQITSAGHWAATLVEDVRFWDKNWRKEGLSERRRILLAENGFYNQTYCGCEFSIRKENNKEIKK